METQASDADGKPLRGCNVNSTFNSTVGALSIATALLIGYLTYLYW
jgi:hypothetical protein